MADFSKIFEQAQQMQARMQQMQSELEKQTVTAAAGDLLRMISAVNTLEPDFKKSGQQQLLIEMLLIRMALLDRTVTIEDLLKGLGAEATSSIETREPASGSVRSQPTQSAVARMAQRPATRPGYPPQLDVPNPIPGSLDSSAARSSIAPTLERQLEWKVEAARELAHFLLGQLGRLFLGLVDSDQNQILEHL